mmetsp:Transcript_42313/g.76753  ORF Transcript_42313/g.76753 Transcript_42313/m.76753 type:complete len:251 (+) Transcript_42313:1044-1796(+)
MSMRRHLSCCSNSSIKTLTTFLWPHWLLRKRVFTAALRSCSRPCVNRSKVMVKARSAASGMSASIVTPACWRTRGSLSCKTRIAAVMASSLPGSAKAAKHAITCIRTSARLCFVSSANLGNTSSPSIGICRKRATTALLTLTSVSVRCSRKEYVISCLCFAPHSGIFSASRRNVSSLSSGCASARFFWRSATPFSSPEFMRPAKASIAAERTSGTGSWKSLASAAKEPLCPLGATCAKALTAARRIAVSL